MPRLALVLIALLSVQPALAVTVYKYVDENGNVVFTDEPRKGAEVLDVQPVPTVPAIPVPPPAAAPAKQADFRYNKVVIVSPEDQKNFINEVEPIVVQVALSPALRKDDNVQLLLNGAAHGAPGKSTTFTLEQLDRGEYQAAVKILDKDGQEVGASSAVQFFVKRHSKLMPKPTPPAKPAKPAAKAGS